MLYSYFILFSVSSRSLYAATFESEFWMIDERAPVENEKAMTPSNIVMMPNILSVDSVAEMSPYPTVVIVVTVK